MRVWRRGGSKNKKFLEEVFINGIGGRSVNVVNYRNVQVSVILSGAKDHDFRFFGLRPQNDEDREKLAHRVNY